MIRVRISFRFDVIPIPSRGFVKHDTCSKSRIGMSHTGASSPQLLYRNEILVLVRKLIPVSCERYMTARFTS